jgi:hypothetical protein
METTIEFTINWIEIAKAIGYVLLGAGIIIAILLYLLRNFRIY